MRAATRYSVAVVVVAALVAAAGDLVPGAVRAGVWMGAGIGLVTQVGVVWAMFVGLFPGRRLLAHGLGMMARLMVFAVVAMLALSQPLELAASTLFALVAVFFVSTVLEPLFLRTEPLKRS